MICVCFSHFSFSIHDFIRVDKNNKSSTVAARRGKSDVKKGGGGGVRGLMYFQLSCNADLSASCYISHGGFSMLLCYAMRIIKAGTSLNT